jgi:inner membrane transporter RhtA
MLLAAAAVLSAILSIQAGAAMGKWLFPAVGPMGATLVRIALAALLLACLFRPWRGRLATHQLRVVAVYGAVLGAMNLAFYQAMLRIPLAIVVAIEFAGPLAVAILASRRRLDLVWAALAALGIVLFLPVRAGAPALAPAGLGFAALAGVCWGTYIVLGQRLGDAPAGTVTSLGMVVATAVVLPAGTWQAGPRLLDPALLPIGLAVAVLSSALPYTLEMWALQRMPARTFGIFMSVEPAVAVAAGFVILGERLTGVQLAATACVVAASAGSALSSPPRGTAAAEAAA